MSYLERTLSERVCLFKVALEEWVFQLYIRKALSDSLDPYRCYMEQTFFYPPQSKVKWAAPTNVTCSNITSIDNLGLSADVEAEEEVRKKKIINKNSLI